MSNSPRNDESDSQRNENRRKNCKDHRCKEAAHAQRRNHKVHRGYTDTKRGKKDPSYKVRHRASLSMLFKIAKEGGNMKSDWLKAYISKMRDGEYTVEIVKVRKNRSLNQNDFYWWPFLDSLCDCMGEIIPEMDEKSRKEAKDGVHDYLKGRFLKGKEIRNPNDRRQRIKLPQSTSYLSTEEFEQFLETVRVYFWKWWWKLPYPNEYGNPWFDQSGIF